MNKFQNKLSKVDFQLPCRCRHRWVLMRKIKGRVRDPRKPYITHGACLGEQNINFCKKDPKTPIDYIAYREKKKNALTFVRSWQRILSHYIMIKVSRH